MNVVYLVAYFSHREACTVHFKALTFGAVAASVLILFRGKRLVLQCSLAGRTTLDAYVTLFWFLFLGAHGVMLSMVDWRCWAIFILGDHNENRKLKLKYI